VLRNENNGSVLSFIKNVLTYLIMIKQTALTGAAALLFDDLKD